MLSSCGKGRRAYAEAQAWKRQLDVHKVILNYTGCAYFAACCGMRVREKSECVETRLQRAIACIMYIH